MSYLVLFRIYNSYAKSNDTETLWWGGIPPRTFINSNEVELCDLALTYRIKSNIITNRSSSSDGVVCPTNDIFTITNIPSGSLANADANYMIACVENNSTYVIDIKVPLSMCSTGQFHNDPHPWINETYDVRYTSVNLVSTNSPRPTFRSWKIPCNTLDYRILVEIDSTVLNPAFIYRQILPSDEFRYSIENAKTKCDDVSYNITDKCMKHMMGEYYPIITKIIL